MKPILVLLVMCMGLQVQCTDNGNSVLDEEEEPVFAAPIPNITVAIGKEAILSCQVEKLGKFRVGWLKEDTRTILTVHRRVVIRSSRYRVSTQGEHTWNLHIRNIKRSDRGCYMCQINTEIMKKQTACVDVHIPPDIEQQTTSPDKEVHEGSSVNLTCRAKGYPSPTITWRREDNHKHIMGSETVTGETLAFERVMRDQMGAYLCIASNNVPPAVSKRIILTVLFEPKVSVGKEQMVARPLDSDVSLECHIEASQPSNEYWKKENGPIIKSMNPHYEIKRVRNGFRIHLSLRIRKFTQDDVGTYTCVADNSVGRSERNIHLDALPPEMKQNRRKPSVQQTPKTYPEKSDILGTSSYTATSNKDKKDIPENELIYPARSPDNGLATDLGEMITPSFPLLILTIFFLHSFS